MVVVETTRLEFDSSNCRSNDIVEKAGAVHEEICPKERRFGG